MNLTLQTGRAPLPSQDCQNPPSLESYGEVKKKRERVRKKVALAPNTLPSVYDPGFGEVSTDLCSRHRDLVQ